MKNLFENTQLAGFTKLFPLDTNLLRSLTVAAILVTAACSSLEEEPVELNVDAALDQAVFTTAGAAALAFAQAVVNGDEEVLYDLLGDDYRKVLPLDEIDREDVENYVDAWEGSNSLLPQGENKVLIVVGEDQWTLPIPIVKGTAGWYFDIEEGLERMRIRQIGRNELATMQAVLAYYDAQQEYAEEDHNGDGMLEYAQKLLSAPGSQDGLFWEVESGEALSPLGPLMGDDTPDGGYYGYHYRILKSQGESAKGGAYNYLSGDRMWAGFALIAWPIEYGESGIMSFLVSHSGIVYEQNLGPEGSETAKNMPSYDPDTDWLPIQEVSSILEHVTP